VLKIKNTESLHIKFEQEVKKSVVPIMYHFLKANFNFWLTNVRTQFIFRSRKCLRWHIALERAEAL